MKHLLELLKWDHLRFTALLNYLSGIVDGLEHDDEPDYTELIELITYLKPGLKGRHQAEELALWRRLASHAGPSGQLVSRLTTLHLSVVEKSMALENGIRDAQAGNRLPLKRLRQLTEDFIGAFREQLAIEEKSIFPLVRQVMPDLAWCGTGTLATERDKPAPVKPDWRI